MASTDYFYQLRHNSNLLLDDRFKEKVEAEIENCSQSSYLYARHNLKQPFLKGEDAILTCPYSTLGYIIEVLKKPWPKAEAILLSKASTASGYATSVLKKRWPKAEKVILQDLERAIAYTRKIIREPWNELELEFIKKLSNYKNNKGAIKKYFRLIDLYKKRIDELKSKSSTVFPESNLEKYLKEYCKKDTGTVFLYMNYKKLKSFPEAEPYILKSSAAAMKYLFEYYKKPWEPAEKYVIRHSSTCYNYSKDILKGRFPKGEIEIMKDDYFRTKYRDLLSSFKVTT